MTGAASDAAAWNALFTSFNQTHGRGATGYASGAGNDQNPINGDRRVADRRRRWPRGLQRRLDEATAFRGPKQLGPALERFRLSQRDLECSLELCSGCRSCDVACPSGVPIAALEVLARAREPRRHGLRDRLLIHGEAMARLAVPLAPVASALLGWAPVRAGLLPPPRRRRILQGEV